MGANKSRSTKDTDQPVTHSEDALQRRRINIQKVRNVLVIGLGDNGTATDDTKKKKWQQMMAELQRANVTNVITFSDSDQCVEFLKTINNHKACMIVSGSVGQHFVSRVQEMPQIDSILIFSSNAQDDEQWSKDSSKIKGVFTDSTLIREALQRAAHHCEQNAMPLSTVTSTKNLEQLDPSFICAQTLKEIILGSNFEEHHLKEFLNYCRDLFADNAEELVQVKALESKYRSETPIWWYTSESFLAPMLNRALRTMNAEIIIHMSFFITDLHRQIEQLHREQHADQSSSAAVLTVYYAQGLSKSDFEQLKKNQRGWIAFHSFVLAKKQFKLPLSFAQDAAARDDLVGVMFMMKMDPSQPSTPFASIDHVSHSRTDEEVLFSMHTVFRINDIKRLTANNRLQEVHLTLSGESDKELATLTHHIRQETFPNLEGWSRLGAVLFKLCQLDQADQVYQVALSQTKETYKKAAIFDQLGSIKDKQEKYSEAITFYEQSLAIYRDNPPAEILGLANLYYRIAMAYFKTDNKAKALSSHLEALKIREQSLPTDHPDLAESYNNIGSLYASVDDYSAAVSYLEKELAINQKILPSKHPHLTRSYMNIGMLYFNLEDYPKALAFYEKLLDIQEKTVPSNYRDLAKSYNNMGAVYNSTSDYAKALSYHEKALAIREKILPPNHPDLGTSFNNMGVTHENLGDYPKACSFFERAIAVGEHSLPPDHPFLQVRRENLERVQEKL